MNLLALLFYAWFVVCGVFLIGYVVTVTVFGWMRDDGSVDWEDDVG